MHFGPPVTSAKIQLRRENLARNRSRRLKSAPAHPVMTGSALETADLVGNTGLAARFRLLTILRHSGTAYSFSRAIIVSAGYGSSFRLSSRREMLRPLPFSEAMQNPVTSSRGRPCGAPVEKLDAKGTILTMSG